MAPAPSADGLGPAPRGRGRRRAVTVALLVAAGCGGGSHEDDAGGPDAATTDAEPADAAEADRTDAGDRRVETTTTSGPIVGVERGGVRVFLGVPYAGDPSGDARFRPPRPAPRWVAAREAIAVGPGCPQGAGNAFTAPATTSEDCLSLNVWAPARAGSRPVMVWLHGGGFVAGHGGAPNVDGARLARAADVVVVTINYRLGVLGFLASAALAAEDPDGRAGNYGLLDQVAALAWVRDNAVAFGGDPSRVTLFGESAGGRSVCHHLALAPSRGLFHRAIVQSGGGCYGAARLDEGSGGPLGLPGAATVAAAVASHVGCAVDDLPCLRAVPADRLVGASDALAGSGLGLPPLGPVLDGALIEEEPIDAIVAGRGAPVPVISGANRDELELFVAGGLVAAETAADYDAYVRRVTGGDRAAAAAIRAAYPLEAFESPRHAVVALGSDATYRCPVLTFGESTRARQPTFLYSFAQLPTGGLAGLRAFHGLEIFYVFDTFDGALVRRTPDDATLVDTMQALWGAFARDGALDPATWPAFDESGPTMRILQTPPALGTEPSASRCDALRAVGLVR